MSRAAVAARSEAWMLLAFAGLHPGRLDRLLEAAGGDPVRVVRRLRADPELYADIGEALSTPVADLLAGLPPDARLVLGDDPGYPSRLRERADAPPFLFVRGEPATWGPAVAVVGTRRCTAYGRRLAHAYGVAIATAGWVLVSGLARGIDGAAHRGTVASGGGGVAVLGCGLDVAYPPEHADLAAALVDEGGAIVSEYPPGTRPNGWRFPPRNRIIAGMAEAVVVVEAAVTGGALITAHLALDAGIPVFAVPGDIDRASSEGTNRLIRDGAHPVLDPDDLIAELALVPGLQNGGGAPPTNTWKDFDD